MTNKKIQVGDRFGKLTIISDSGERVYGNVIWVCRCDCGENKKVRGGNLMNGGTNSCGCIRVENTKNLNRKHDMSHSPEYTSWYAMKRRCNNRKGHNYKWYGGRGITVCEEWDKSFLTFIRDMGRKPSPKHSLDRIDNNSGYNPKNCRWATPHEQVINQRKRVFYQRGITARNTSGYCGVCFDKETGKYRVVIHHLGKTIHVGRFKDKMEAANRYNQEARKLFGKKAKLNDTSETKK